MQELSQKRPVLGGALCVDLEKEYDPYQRRL